MRRIPIGPEVGIEDFDRAAYRMNLDSNNFIAPTATTPLEEIYNVRGQRTYLHYIDDKHLGFPYIAVSGDSYDDLAAQIAQRIHTITPDDLKRSFEQPPGDVAELKRLIGHAALLAPAKYEPTFDRYFRFGFEHPSPEVRRQAILGVGYAGWPELAKPLRELAEKDPDETVRREARGMLDVLTQQEVR